MATTGETPTADETTGEQSYESGTLKSESLPHIYAAGAIGISLSNCEIDGSDLDTVGDLKETSRLISIETASDWDILTVEASVTIDEETLEEVFPPDEWDDPPGRLVVVKTCDTAIARDRKIVKDESLSADEYSVPIEIRRDRYRGEVTLQPYLVRAGGKTSESPNFATRAGARIADGESWTVRIDELRDEGGLLQPRIESFSDHDHFPDETHIHYLNLDEPRNPQLFLNRDHPTIIKILNNEGTTGGPPRLRDVVYGYIEHSVWTQLVLRTAQDTDPDTGETEHDWQEDVIDIFHDELYDELDRDEAASQLANDADGVEDLNILVQKIEEAVNNRINIPYDVRTLIEEGIQNVD